MNRVVNNYRLLQFAIAAMLIVMGPQVCTGQQDQDRRFASVIRELDRPDKPLFHSLLIFQNGLLTVERYWSGTDLVDGKPTEREFGPYDLHDLRSCSKSVVGLLVGIAIREEKLPAAHFPAFLLFPDYQLEQSDTFTELHRAIRIRHLLDMRTGLDWQQHESEDHVNNEAKLEGSSDVISYVWSQSVNSRPGEKFDYNSGATALLGRAIKLGTGKSLKRYAREKLFGPLAITQWDWLLDSDGDTAAHFGLRLRPRDMMKIGRLVLQKGRWNGKQVVPQEWVGSLLAFRDRANSYKNQWWLENLSSRNKQTRVISAKGQGGQRILVFPDLQAVVVVTAGHYEDPKAQKQADEFVRQRILPVLMTE